MKTACNAISKLCKVFYWISGLLLFCMVALCAADVICRLVGSPLIWANELLRFLMFYMSFTAVIYLVSEKRNLEVDLTAIFFPKKKQLLKKTHIIGDLVLLAVLIYLIFPSWSLTIQNVDVTSSAMQWPMCYVYGIMPFSFLICAIAQLKNIAVKWSCRKENAEKEVE